MQIWVTWKKENRVVLTVSKAAAPNRSYIKCKKPAGITQGKSQEKKISKKLFIYITNSVFKLVDVHDNCHVTI